MKRVQEYLASLNNKLITKDSVEKVMEKHINTFSGIVAKKMKSDKDQIREVLARLRRDLEQALIIPGLVGPDKNEYRFESLQEFVTDMEQSQAQLKIQMKTYIN